MKIYHNPRCQKSRETLAIIHKHKIAPEIVEYLKDTPSKAELRELVNMLGITPEQLIRKNESIYKEKYQGRELSDDGWLQAMVDNPKLIERPIVVEGNKAVLGRPPENIEQLF